MLDCLITSSELLIPIYPVFEADFDSWLDKQSSKVKNWLHANEFKAKPGSTCIMPDRDGNIKQVFLGVANCDDFWSFGALSDKLLTGDYEIHGDWSVEQLQRVAIAWGLGRYKFTAYKTSRQSKAKLKITEACDLDYVENIVTSINLARDLINHPAEDMNPSDLAKAVTSVAVEFGAEVSQIIGEDLRKHKFEAIYAVGKASINAPRLIDLNWHQSKKFPTVVLVGKGVCFDSGGLDLKPSPYMKDMDKDMAGAAHVLSLARMVMGAKLPINLRVLIPAVENLVSGSSYKPGDIIKTYKGLTVEVTNTDAEGRLILADALALASESKPDLIIDFATLTGARSVALGPEIVAMFSTNESLAQNILDFSKSEQDPMCILPIYQPYRELMDSHIADLVNSSDTRYGGAITAALFLQEFVECDIPWVHFDLEAHNDKSKPGRPKGGEAQGLRAVFRYLVGKYGK